MKSLLILVLFISSLVSISQENSKLLKITHLSGDFYVHTSYKLIENMLFPSNGLFAIADEGAVLFDTPWDENQTRQLIDTIEKRFQKKILCCIVTHSHDDRTAGLDLLKQKGVMTYSTKLTKEICIEKKEKYAEHTFNNDTLFTIQNLSFETFFPGEGHTKDNIVIYFPESKILYGACVVKSPESDGLGNVSEANLKEWPKSVFRILDKYPVISFVVPGHLNWADRKALTHTLYLLNK
jgi:glyoxylase-like metal-dependent hydrolase (beta-lactamase superfamily II)